MEHLVGSKEIGPNALDVVRVEAALLLLHEKRRAFGRRLRRLRPESRLPLQLLRLCAGNRGGRRILPLLLSRQRHHLAQVLRFGARHLLLEGELRGGRRCRHDALGPTLEVRHL